MQPGSNRKLLFLGNEGNLIKEILKLKHIDLVGVVGDKVSDVDKEYFGSSYEVARELGLPIVSQRDFNADYDLVVGRVFRDIDIVFVQGYHYRIREALLKHNEIKFVNFHQSLLPRYAGRHPLNWAIINDETITGITFHYINRNFDEGDIILQRRISISRRDNIVSLYNKTISLALKHIGKVFELIYDERFVPIKQNLQEFSYLPPRKPEDGEIFETDTVREVKNKIRALVVPYPGAFVIVENERITIDGVKTISDFRNYTTTKFVDRYQGQIILRVKDGLLRVTRVRPKDNS